jgi:hypothetical protein
MIQKLVIILITLFLILLVTTCDQTAEPQNQDNDNTASSRPNMSGSEITVSDAVSGNSGNHEDPEDYIWDDSEVTQIVLNDNAISTNGPGVIVDGFKVTITSGGNYSIRGSLTDGQIIVDATDQNLVRLILNETEINCSENAPIIIVEAEKAILFLTENTENALTDGSSYDNDSETDEPNAAIFSKTNLTICGEGALTVTGNYNDGIASKDGLIIKGGHIHVTAADDGIRGKDYLIVENGDITVNVKGDGLKSDNDEDGTKGYILIEDGTLDITSGGDAFTAETDVLIRDGKVTLVSGGGSDRTVSGVISAKGIKALSQLVLDDGTFTINSADDGIHSNGSIAINGGIISIASGDDGIHADSALGINGGSIDITKSFEGLESRSVILINNGDIHVVSSDDGFNVASGLEGNGFDRPPGPGQGGFQPPPQGGPGVSSGNYNLFINGGYIAVSANGDGFDINGVIEMTDGVVIIHGPTSDWNGALDYDGSFKLAGGFLVAAGSSGMAQAPGNSSTQYSVLLNFRSALQAGTLFHIQTSDGNEILSFKPVKKYQSIAFSSPDLKRGTTYDIYYGGSSTGTEQDGLSHNGVYNPGTKFGSFTVSSITTKLFIQ